MPAQRRPEIPEGADRRWNFRALARSSRIILAVQAGLLLALGALMLHAVATQREARAHVWHEVEAILALHTMLEAVIDAETGERGFLLNGDGKYLEPLAQARGRYAAARERARRMIELSPYPEEIRDLSPLDRLVAARIDIIDRNILLTVDGRRSEAISPARSEQGRAAMNAVRAEIARLIAVMQANRAIAGGKARRSEARLVPLLALLGGAIVSLVAVSVLLERSQAVASTRAQQAEALRAAKGQAELVARELNHRVKNLFAVVLSIISLTGRQRQADRETMNELRARIHALSTAHAVSQGQIGSDRAGLAEVAGRVLEPYADARGNRIVLEGPPIELPMRMVTPIGMIIHELATNAAKYGAFSSPAGTVRIAWQREEAGDGAGKVRLVWIESGGPALEPEGDPQMRPGFGATMLDLAARQLEGSLERHWKGSGLRIELTFPLPA